MYSDRGTLSSPYRLLGPSAAADILQLSSSLPLQSRGRARLLVGNDDVHIIARSDDELLDDFFHDQSTATSQAGKFVWGKGRVHFCQILLFPCWGKAEQGLEKPHLINRSQNHSVTYPKATKTFISVYLWCATACDRHWVLLRKYCNFWVSWHMTRQRISLFFVPLQGPCPASPQPWPAGQRNVKFSMQRVCTTVFQVCGDSLVSRAVVRPPVLERIHGELFPWLSVATSSASWVPPLPPLSSLWSLLLWSSC